MPTDSASQELPRRKTGWFLSWVEQRSLVALTATGVALYFGVAVLVSGIELAAQCGGVALVCNDGCRDALTWWDILYFNLITILTVGYGDLHPVSYGRALAVGEAFVGVGLFSVLVAVIALKAMLPPRNTVVFSKRAFYCTVPERFLIVFVDTTRRKLDNVAISSYFKLGGDWRVTPAVTAPLITRSVQTFHVQETYQADLIAKLRNGDCLRVGLVAGLGFTSFSASVQYSSRQVLMIPDRQKLIDFFEDRWDPDFADPEFRDKFHNGCHPNALTLEAAVESARASQVKTL